MSYRLLIFALVSFAMTGCGDGDAAGGDAAPGGTADAAPPAPDAEPVCQQTQCGAFCVNTETDRFHCGGCDMPCASPARDCVASECTGCPDPFVPDNPSVQSLFAQAQMGSLFAVGTFTGTGGVRHALIVGADTTAVEPDSDHDFAETDAVNVVIGYKIDVALMLPQSSYGATTGVVHIDEICDTGVSGTITDVGFAEVDLNGNTVPDACSVGDVTLSFALGSCEAELDAGTM